MIFQLSQEKMKIASQCFFKFRAAWVSWVNNNHKTKKKRKFCDFWRLFERHGKFLNAHIAAMCTYTQYDGGRWDYFREDEFYVCGAGSEREKVMLLHFMWNNFCQHFPLKACHSFSDRCFVHAQNFLNCCST